MSIPVIIMGTVVAVIVLFLLIRAAVNRIVVAHSKKGWGMLLRDSRTDDSFLKSFGVPNITYAIGKVLLPVNADYFKFMSNLLYLSTEGDESKKIYSREAELLEFFSYCTSSIREFRFQADRPMGLSTWFIAAFPDIVKWINNDGLDTSELLYDGIPEDQLDAAFDKDKDSVERVEVYRVMVANYLKKVKPALEIRGPVGKVS